MNDHPSVQWIERLNDSDSSQRIVALTELIDDQDTVSSEVIVPLLEDAEVTVRELAVQLLEEIGNPNLNE